MEQNNASQQKVGHCDKTTQQIFFIFIILNTFDSLIFHAKIQPKILIGSGEDVHFVVFATFSNSGHLGYSTWPNFIILRPWSQIMHHENFQNCRSSSFKDEDVWVFVFKCWRTMHNAHRTHWYGNSSLWPFRPGELIMVSIYQDRHQISGFLTELWLMLVFQHRICSGSVYIQICHIFKTTVFLRLKDSFFLSKTIPKI